MHVNCTCVCKYLTVSYDVIERTTSVATDVRTVNESDHSINNNFDDRVLTEYSFWINSNEIMSFFLYLQYVSVRSYHPLSFL